VLPRGNFFGGRSGQGYNFPALHPPGALNRLVDDALGRFAAHTGVQAARGRLILTAHSGGGAALMRILRHTDPDEVHAFDALYTDPDPLIAWARRRIARGDGALRVLYREGEGTARNSRAVRAAIHAAGTGLRAFRVESTRVTHGQIPGRFGWRLLADATADLPAVAGPPAVTATREAFDQATMAPEEISYEGDHSEWEVTAAWPERDRPPAPATVAPPAPSIVDHPCRHLSSAALRWPRHPELESFMRATYQAHVARSCTRRAFQPSIPATRLAAVSKKQVLRRDAAPLAIRMLDDARTALRQAQQAGDPTALAVRGFGISSGYRSATRQYGLWNSRFPGYFEGTKRQRAELPGGPTGPRAAAWLAAWIGKWLAAPGFSNHNDGRAIDLYCQLSGATLSANRSDIPRWRNSWLHGWLVANAHRYQFRPYSAEPWHWEHRPG
jgi:hypothetical protein